MKTMLFAAAAVGALAISPAAMAQAAGDWTGAYLGGFAGYGWQADNDEAEGIGFDTDLDGTFNDTVTTPGGGNAFAPGVCDGSTLSPTLATACRGDEDGFEFGVKAGYDWQFGNVVVGLVGEAARTDVKDSVTAFSTTPAAYTMNRRLKGLLAARARVGFAMGDTLPYVTGGYAWGDMERSFQTTNTANTFTRVSDDDDGAHGWQLGGGVEHKVTPDLSLGLEYLYTRLDDDDYRVRATGPAGGPFTTVRSDGTDFRRTEDDFDVHSVRLGASYRF